MKDKDKHEWNSSWAAFENSSQILACETAIRRNSAKLLRLCSFLNDKLNNNKITQIKDTTSVYDWTLVNVFYSNFLNNIKAMI